MVYRHHADDLAPEAPVDPDATLKRYNVSGRHGREGRRGTDGADGSSYGKDGAPGSDAGPAEAGVGGGYLRVSLSTTDDEVVRVLGKRRRRGDEAEKFEDRVDIGDAGYVDLLANGGRGGDGGDGGDGGSGAGGYPGRNATRHSSGGDGGPGGNGGYGGDATDGAHGGEGGKVRIVVREKDMHLAMLVRHQIRGGEGGTAGSNGRGGAGGSGGRGGSSYSWTETSSYTDSQGNRRTRTTWHTSSGGSRGPSGYDGDNGTARVVDGARGQDGELTITVRSGDDKTVYPSCFDLRLDGFEHASENQDGIYEPGERIRVSRFSLRNCGGMPTPKVQDIVLTLEQHGWILPEDGQLVVPHTLSAGESHTFEEEALWFEVGDFQPKTPTEPLAVKEHIRTVATLPAIRRPFRDLEDDLSGDVGEFTIRFPLVASELESLRSLAPGETTAVRWTITNDAKTAFGREADNGRRVRFRLYAQYSELDDEHVALFDSDMQRVSCKDGYTLEIDRIDAGETRSFEAAVGFLADAPHYRSVNLWLTLELGKIREPDVLRPIQHRDVEVRVADRYTRDDDADLLLVLNHRTTREAVDAWREVADDLGFTLNTYDLSLEQGLDLEDDGAGGSLIDDFAGQTMMILNPVVSTPAGQMSAHVLASKEQLLTAAKVGVNIGFVGMGVSISRLIAPTAEPDPRAHPDEGAIVKAIEGGAALEHSSAVLELDRSSVWSSGGHERHLRKIAERLAAKLAYRYPQRRFAVIQEHDGSLRSGGLFKRFRLGTLEVREMCPAAGRLVRAKVADEELHSPEYIQSEANILTLLLTRSFEEKLARMDALLADVDGGERREELLHWVVDAMLVDLANEQAALLETRWRHGMTTERMLACLPCLRRLADFVPVESARLDPSSAIANPLIRLVASLRYWAWAHWRFWEWPLFFLRRAPRAALITRDLTWQFLFNMVSKGSTAQSTTAAMKTMARQLRVDFDEIRTEYKNDTESWTLHSDSPRSHEANAERLLRWPLERAGVTTDAEVRDTWPQRIITQEELRELEMEDAERAAKRREAMRQWEEAAGDLKHGRSTAVLAGLQAVDATSGPRSPSRSRT